jgi:hypothetical protein
MRDDQKVTDWDGAVLTVGSRVIYGSPPPGKEAEYAVTVVGISDYDVDYCDETQRPEMSPPKVKVRFDDGSEDEVATHDATKITWNDYPDGPDMLVFRAEDLEVVQLRIVTPDARIIPIRPVAVYDQEADYGEGKTRAQDEADSVKALGIIIIYGSVVLFAIAAGVYLTWWFFR